MKEIYGDIDSPELSALEGYMDLLDAKADKAAKLQYIAAHAEVNWAQIEGSSPYAKGKAIAYLKELQSAYTFAEDSFEAKMVNAEKLMNEEKNVKKEVKELAAALHLKTKETIERLTDEQALDLLRLKWIAPLCNSLRAIPGEIISGLEKSVQALADKYAVTYSEIGRQIEQSEKMLSAMIDDLEGNAYDMRGLAEFKTLLTGENDE